MTIYCLYIYDKSSNCVYCKDWKKERTTALPIGEEQKLVYGMVLSLRSLCTKLSPSESNRQAFRSYTTANYKLHYFETPTQLKFVLMTDVNAAGMHELLKQIYSKAYVDCVSKNPMIKIGDDLSTSELFVSRLDDMVAAHVCY